MLLIVNWKLKILWSTIGEEFSESHGINLKIFLKKPGS
jgi:hypothetical protein